MLKDYYALRGWVNGVVPEKLKELAIIAMTAFWPTRTAGGGRQRDFEWTCRRTRCRRPAEAADSAPPEAGRQDPG
jgi:hypothetical protein